MLTMTEFVWKVWASIKCFQNLDIIFLQLCGKCGTSSNAFKMLRGTKFLWKVWASLKSFKTHAKWFLHLCGKGGKSLKCFKDVENCYDLWLEDVNNIWVCVVSAGLLKMLSKPGHIIFEIMWKVRDLFKCF